MTINGIHHVTSVSAQIGRNADFYTRVLGLRLVKKSVNQDDPGAYHLFYADKIGSPGTDMTFFDWPQMRPENRGTDSIALTAFRVNGPEAMNYWMERLENEGVKHQSLETFAGRSVLRFEDPEGQRLMLVDDSGADFEGEIWDGSDVPEAYALRGFFATMISVPGLGLIEPILSQVLQFREARQEEYPDGATVHIFETAGGGPGRELWVAVEPEKPVARLGAGGTHHVAWRVADTDEQLDWHERIAGSGLHISSVIDRYYFKSIYFRISRGILFEIATDGPGFTADEDLSTLGDRLALPPFLEPRREMIEANLKPIEV
jgi:glyoxalase family protein